MALPQRDNCIDAIHRLEGLIAYAEAHGDWDEAEKGARPRKASPATK